MSFASLTATPLANPTYSQDPSKAKISQKEVPRLVNV